VTTLERLGIAAELKAKTRLARPPPHLFDTVAKGEVEVGLTQISEIVAVAGIDLVGPLVARPEHNRLRRRHSGNQQECRGRENADPVSLFARRRGGDQGEGDGTLTQRLPRKREDNRGQEEKYNEALRSLRLSDSVNN